MTRVALVSFGSASRAGVRTVRKAVDAEGGGESHELVQLVRLERALRLSNGLGTVSARSVGSREARGDHDRSKIVAFSTVEVRSVRVGRIATRARGFSTHLAPRLVEVGVQPLEYLRADARLVGRHGHHLAWNAGAPSPMRSGLNDPARSGGGASWSARQRGQQRVPGHRPWTLFSAQ